MGFAYIQIHSNHEKSYMKDDSEESVEFEEPIDYNSRLYPEGDRSFGDFIPGKSQVQMPTFSFMKQEKTLPTFKEECL